jgi:hypothetical protein
MSDHGTLRSYRCMSGYGSHTSSAAIAFFQ